VAKAVAEIPDGATVMIGGFGGSDAPIELIHALIDHGPKDLTIVNYNAGNGRIGIAALINAGRVRKVVCSFPRSSDSRAFNEKYLAGEIELELVPQGTRNTLSAIEYRACLAPRPFQPGLRSPPHRSPA
jgi:3-oxoadipate CoA-transferase alpha subunit